MLACVPSRNVVVDIYNDTDTPEQFDTALESLAGACEFAAPGTEFTRPPLVLDRVAAPNR